MSELVIAALVFVTIVGLGAGGALYMARRRLLRERLRRAEEEQTWDADILRSEPISGDDDLIAGIAGFSPREALATLIYQSGQSVRLQSVLAMMMALAAVATLLAMFRTGSLLIGLVCGAFAASAPIVFLVLKRSQRLNRFQHQLPDALDIITRATRAGHALSAGLQLVARWTGARSRAPRASLPRST
jgi:tight adherence protein B